VLGHLIYAGLGWPIRDHPMEDICKKLPAIEKAVADSETGYKTACKPKVDACSVAGYTARTCA